MTSDEQIDAIAAKLNQFDIRFGETCAEAFARVLCEIGLKELLEAGDKMEAAGGDLRYDEYGVIEYPLGHLAAKWDEAVESARAAKAKLERETQR